MRNLKLAAKRFMLRTGVFPYIRAAYRRVNPNIRAGKAAERDLYSAFINPGDLVFDIGANLGQKSEVFLECGARVVAVEPNSLCHSTLRHLFGSNSKFSLVPKAVGPRPGTMNLHFSGTSSTASLRNDWAHLSVEGPPETIEVEITTLDELVGQYGIPDFCKIDVEGFEPEVLQGLSQPLPCVSFEYHTAEADRFQASLCHLASLGDVWVNVMPMDQPRFALAAWANPSALSLDNLPTAGDCSVRCPSAATEEKTGFRRASL